MMETIQIKLKPTTMDVWVVLSYGQAHSDVLFFRKKPNVKNEYFFCDEADNCIGRMGIYHFNQFYGTDFPCEYNQAKLTKWKPAFVRGEANSKPKLLTIEMPLDEDGDIIQILPDIG